MYVRDFVSTDATTLDTYQATTKNPLTKTGLLDPSSSADANAAQSEAKLSAETAAFLSHLLHNRPLMFQTQKDHFLIKKSVGSWRCAAQLSLGHASY
eukprot:3653412-Rhodomonas_salina.3